MERYLGVEVGVDADDVEAQGGEVIDRIHPHAWFDAPPPEDSSDEEEDDERPARRKTSKRAPKEKAYTGPVWFDHWQPNLPIEPVPFQLPYFILNARQPRYEHLRRNQYMAGIAPVKLPRDEVAVCSCRLPPGVMRTAPAQPKQTTPPADDGAAAGTAPGPSETLPPPLPAAQRSSVTTPSAPLATLDAQVDPGARNTPSKRRRGDDAVGAAHALPKRLRCCDNDACENFTMRIFCDLRRCPAGRFCANAPFNMRGGGSSSTAAAGAAANAEEYVPDIPPPPKLRPFLTERRGWALRTTTAVPKGAFVVEYVGEVITERECESRLWACKAAGETNFYLMQLSAGKIIDARHKGNVSRLINSSCDPNCETQKWTDASTDETRVGIFALRDIAAGEELTYDYCFQHFGASADHSFRCECGAPNCRGTLDAAKARAAGA